MEENTEQIPDTDPCLICTHKEDCQCYWCCWWAEVKDEYEEAYGI